MHNDATDRTNPYASPQDTATTSPRPKRVVLVAGAPHLPFTATLVSKRWNYRLVRLRGPIDADVSWNGWFNRVFIDGKGLSPTKRHESLFWIAYDYEFVLETPFRSYSATLHVKHGFLPGVEARLKVDGMLMYGDREELGQDGQGKMVRSGSMGG